jgi:hypothetical protein
VRLIRTETYFRWSEVREHFVQSEKYDPGIAIVWMKTHTNRRVEFPSINGFRNLNQILAEPAERPRFVRQFLDISIRGARSDVRHSFELAWSGPVLPLGASVERWPRRIVNPELVDEVFHGDVIVERSPPDAIPLHGLIGQNAWIAVGSWVGFHAGGDGWIMLISIPGGVILMGAAIGIARGLMAGLGRAVERAVDHYLGREGS